MATDARHRRDATDARLVLAVVLVVAVLALAAYWWPDGRETTVGTGTAPAGPVQIGPDDLLGVGDMKAVWPGPWAVLRTGEPADFERPLVGCTEAVSPVADPDSAQARWSIHAPPQSDGPALSQVVAATGDPATARAALDRARAWMTGCPPNRAGETGTRRATVLRELPSVDGFLAQVDWSSPDSEAYELVAVGRVDGMVVLLSYGEYGPSGQIPRTPDPSRLLDAFDRAVDKARRAG